MTLDPDAAYLVLAARDARYDGRLFVGVTSTGVYCRPICRVRTPMRRNCRFFDTPAQAEAAAFRPCLKCRPEIAPGSGLPWTVMDASRTLARQAALALDAQSASGDAPNLAALAAKLGVSDRHLRRIFSAEHGVTPMQYLQTRRLLLAKQLLTDTPLPMTQVALASGFGSLRRFNAAFAGTYRMSPSRLRSTAYPGAPTTAAQVRRKSGPSPIDDSVSVLLGYRAPYDVAALLKFFAQRSVPGVETVAAQGIRRSVRAGSIGAAAGWIEASFDAESPRVRVRLSATLVPDSGQVLQGVRRWLDLDASPQAIDEALCELPGAPGLRLPGSLDAFELAVRAVLGQQITVAGARTLATRFIGRFGTPLATPWPDVDRSFPAPAAIARAPVERIAELGIVRQRAAALVALARAWPVLEPLLQERGSPEPLIDALCELPGFGPWTAHYIAMRALGWPDAFPPRDVALLNALRNGFGIGTQREADTRAQAWRPWRSYAVLRLWNTLEKTS